MNVELDEVRRFLADHHPFQTLPADILATIPQTMTMVYVRRGQTLITAGKPNDYLWVLRSGAVDVLDNQGVLLDRRDTGRSFGYSTLLGERASLYTIIAVEDSLILKMHRDHFIPLSHNSPELERYYSGQSARIRAAAQQLRQEDFSDILRTALGSFAIPNPAHISPEESIQSAARLMGEKNVSSLLVMESGSLEGRLLGIMTDRDMRKAIANATNITQPVSTVMTTAVRTAAPEQLVIEALLTMAELNIHHLPIVNAGVTVGIVTSADIMRLLQANPLYFAGDLARKDTPEGMREVVQDAHKVVVRFIERGAAAQEISSLLTLVADSTARRLLTLAEEELGAAPIPFAFVVVGSQGRREMGVASDQDNALILGNEYDPNIHGQYFQRLGSFVCEGLATAGQELCPGEMMASNPQWRMSEQDWNNTFHTWVTAPDPDALLYAQTFFDMRGIYGDAAMAQRVHAQAMASAKNSPRMHAHLAALAARREPPLGFFRGLVVDRAGEYANTLNIKKGGIAALVQMARLFAIAGGRDALSTTQRLEGAAGTAVSSRSAEDLVAAFEFFNSITLKHQMAQIREGKQPDYHINPQALSKLDRENLRDAFHIIKSVQSALSIKYPVRNI